MHPVRRSLIVILSPLLPLLLFLTALDWGVVQTAGSSQNLKTIVAESGIYSQVVPGLLNQMSAISTSVGQIPTSDPTVRQAANQALTPNQVKQDSEQAIDSIYAWLEGKTAQPDFQINLSQAQTDFATNLAAAAESKAASLPACTTPFTATSFDAYNATCLPRGLTPQMVSQQIRSEVSGGKSFINQTTIGPGDFKGSQNNQSAFNSQWKSLPKQYQLVKKSPFILILLSILTAAGLILLNPSWRKGLRHVGFTFLVFGIFMLFFSWALGRTSTHYIEPKITINNSALQTDVRNIVGDMIHRIDNNYWLFGGIYTGVGLLAVASPLLFQRRALSQPAEAVAGDSPAAPPSDKPTKKNGGAQPR